MNKPLTTRESQVLALIAYGKTNQEVSAVLGIVEKTVKNIIMGVFTKMDVRNRTEAALTFHNIEWRGK